MTRQLPNHDDVRAAMDEVLVAARSAGRLPTITAVERTLGVPHATFYRNYRDLITEHFQPRAAETHANATGTQPRPGQTPDTVALQRLRHENAELRRLVVIYEEAIRQLTLTNHELHEKLHHTAKITPLPTRETPR